MWISMTELAFTGLTTTGTPLGNFIQLGKSTRQI